jgi:hypothetical protein
MGKSTRRSFLAGTALAMGAAASGALDVATTATRDTKPARRLDPVDVLVCGGGPAGIAAAVNAARGGARVLLIERYGRLGGMAVHALVGPMMGAVLSPFVDEVLGRIGGRHAAPERMDLEYAALAQEAGAQLLLHAWIHEVMRDGTNVGGVRVVTKQGILEMPARLTIDATGDGDVAALAGAEFEQGRDSDKRLQPVSIMYRIAGVDTGRGILCGSEEEARVVRVPGGTWEEVVMKGQADGELPPEIGVIRVYKAAYPGERVINATQVNGIDGTNPYDLTRAELEARRQAFTVVEFLRKHAPGHEQARVSAMPAVVGVRETRRILGTEYLTRDDVIQGRSRKDAVVRRADFPVDIHNPTGAGQAEGTAARVKPYDIPYGCLVPRGIDGLLTAGRCISGSHDAHASYRVQCIAMAIGAAAGAAAAIAVKTSTPPAKVDPAEVQEKLGLA